MSEKGKWCLSWAASRQETGNGTWAELICDIANAHVSTTTSLHAEGQQSGKAPNVRWGEEWILRLAVGDAHLEISPAAP